LTKIGSNITWKWWDPCTCFLKICQQQNSCACFVGMDWYVLWFKLSCFVFASKHTKFYTPNITRCVDTKLPIESLILK